MNRIALLALFLTSTAVFADAKVQIKPGLWESKVTRQVLDGRDMTAQLAALRTQADAAMANMTPEQRAQVAASLKNSDRACITPAVASDYGKWIEQGGVCHAPQKVSMVGNKLRFDATCLDHGMTAVGTGEAVFDGDKVSLHLDLAATDGQGQKHKVQADWQYKYLGTDCQGIAPMEHLPQQMSSAQ